MSPHIDIARILVSLGGLGLAAAVLWYFLAPSRGIAATAAPVTGGVQEASLLVKGGYVPDTLRLARGTPARITIRREEEGECSEEILIPEFHVRRFLPPYETVVIEIMPDRAGEFPISCGMGMLHGRLIVS